MCVTYVDHVVYLFNIHPLAFMLYYSQVSIQDVPITHYELRTGLWDGVCSVTGYILALFVFYSRLSITCVHSRFFLSYL